MNPPDLAETSTSTIGPKSWDFTYLLAYLRYRPKTDIVWQSNSPKLAYVDLKATYVALVMKLLNEF